MARAEVVSKLELYTTTSTNKNVQHYSRVAWQTHELTVFAGGSSVRQRRAQQHCSFLACDDLLKWVCTSGSANDDVTVLGCEMAVAAGGLLSMQCSADLAHTKEIICVTYTTCAKAPREPVLQLSAWVSNAQVLHQSLCDIYEDW